MLLSQLTVMKNARSIFTYIQDDKGNTLEIFRASRGWFDGFIKRSSLYNIKKQVKQLARRIKLRRIFLNEIKNDCYRGYYPPKLIFNVNEAGLIF